MEKENTKRRTKHLILLLLFSGSGKHPEENMLLNGGDFYDLYCFVADPYKCVACDNDFTFFVFILSLPIIALEY